MPILQGQSLSKMVELNKRYIFWFAIFSENFSNQWQIGSIKSLCRFFQTWMVLFLCKRIAVCLPNHVEKKCIANRRSSFAQIERCFLERIKIGNISEHSIYQLRKINLLQLIGRSYCAQITIKSSTFFGLFEKTPSTVFKIYTNLLIIYQNVR